MPSMAAMFANEVDYLNQRVRELETELATSKKLFERSKRWLLYFTVCQAATLEDIERRSGTSQAARNRNRGILNTMLRAIDGAEFDRFASKPESDEKRARDVAERFPYLPATIDKSAT